MAKKYTFEMPSSTYKPSTYSDSSGTYAGEIAKERSALEQAQASKPLPYQSQYADRINNVIGQIQGRSFAYDVNADSLFQQLKAIYNAQGKSAMTDAVGQASAMTGGYGNSYAVAVGNQARQAANEQLYNRIPELYQLALSRYQQEGNDLQSEYGILSNEDATAYGRYREDVNDWNNEVTRRETALNKLRGMNQNIWSQNESNTYNANQQKWDNYRWGEQMAENQRQFDAQMAYNYSRSASNGSGGSSGGSSGVTTTTPTYDSVFSLATGKQRFSNTGTLFTEKQYNGFRQQVGMNRGNEGRIELVYDALCEGKITEEQAEDTLRHYGISDDEFVRVANQQWNDAVLMAKKRNK